MENTNTETKKKKTYRPKSQKTAKTVYEKIANEVWVNEETGERRSFYTTTKDIAVNTNFWKIWMMDLLAVIDELGKGRIKVMKYILENLSPYDNSFSSTIDEICVATKSGSATVVSAIKQMKDADFLIEVRQSFYRINPQLIVKGRENHQRGIMVKYNEENPKNKK